MNHFCQSRNCEGVFSKKKKMWITLSFFLLTERNLFIKSFLVAKESQKFTHPHFSLRIWASMPLCLGTSEKQRILTGVLKMSLLIKGICLQIAHGGCETGWRKKTMQCLLGKIHVLLNWRYFLWRIKLCFGFDQRQFSRIFLCSNKPIWRMLGQRHENLHNSTVCRI